MILLELQKLSIENIILSLDEIAALLQETFRNGFPFDFNNQINNIINDFDLSLILHANSNNIIQGIFNIKIFKFSDGLLGEILNWDFVLVISIINVNAKFFNTIHIS